MDGVSGHCLHEGRFFDSETGEWGYEVFCTAHDEPCEGDREMFRLPAARTMGATAGPTPSHGPEQLARMNGLTDVGPLYSEESWEDVDDDGETITLHVCSECGYPCVPAKRPHFRRALPTDSGCRVDGLVHCIGFGRLTPEGVASANAAALAFEIAAAVAASD